MSGDGYLVAAGALHPSGITYMYVHGPDELMPVELPGTTVAKLVLAAEQRQRGGREALADGATIARGTRHETLFSLALERVRAGLGYERVLDEMAAINTTRCDPPLERRDVEEQVRG